MRMPLINDFLSVTLTAPIARVSDRNPNAPFAVASPRPHEFPTSQRGAPGADDASGGVRLSNPRSRGGGIHVLDHEGCPTG